MNITFLKNVTTRYELKKAYKELARQLHPDFGGTTENMIQLNNEFEYLFTRLETTKQENASNEIASDYMEKIQDLLHVPGIEIELIGNWLWITGDTKPVKDTLKAAGFKYSGKKVAWYWYPGKYRKRSKRKLSLEEIRSLYGSQAIDKDEKEQIA